MESNRRRLRKLVSAREFGIAFALIALVFVFQSINPVFLSWDNVTTILRAASFTGVMAAGIALLMISGSIDLSVGSMAGLAAIITSYLIVKESVDPVQAIGISLLVGCLVGAINYFIVFKVKIPAFLATIGMMYIIRGCAYYISNGYTIYPLPESVGEFGKATWNGISWHFMIFISLIVVGELILRKTVYGLETRATGSDRETAINTEVNVKKISITTFMIAGFFASLSGILLMSRIITGEPNIGQGWELQAITACAIGGVSLFGYEGSFIGVFLGVLVIQIIQNGLVVIGLSPYLQTIVIGIILLATAAFDYQRRHRLDL